MGVVAQSCTAPLLTTLTNYYLTTLQTEGTSGHAWLALAVELSQSKGCNSPIVKGGIFGVRGSQKGHSIDHSHTKQVLRKLAGRECYCSIIGNSFPQPSCQSCK